MLNQEVCLVLLFSTTPDSLVITDAFKYDIPFQPLEVLFDKDSARMHRLKQKHHLGVVLHHMDTCLQQGQ